jgi:hypothetical protein
VPPVDPAQVLDDLARPRARAVAAVQEVPAEDRRVVLVGDAGVDVDVVQERGDVLLDVAQDVRSVQNGAMLTSEQFGTSIARQRR